MINKRPFLLYLLVLVFILYAMVSVFGIVEMIRSWNWLSAFEVKPHPIYLIFKNTFFVLTCLTAGVSLWLRMEWAPAFDCFTVLICTAWFWMDRLILTQNPLTLTRHLLLMFLTVFILCLMLLSIYLMKPFMKVPWLDQDSDLSVHPEEGK